MRFLRPFIAALLFLAWLPAVNACALAAAFPNAVSDCCEEGGVPVAPGNSDESSCAECLVLESGFALSALQPLIAPSPPTWEDVWLTKLLLALAARRADEGPPVEYRSTAPEPPLWLFVARTALPVRGPSLIA